MYKVAVQLKIKLMFCGVSISKLKHSNKILNHELLLQISFFDKYLFYIKIYIII